MHFLQHLHHQMEFKKIVFKLVSQTKTNVIMTSRIDSAVLFCSFFSDFFFYIYFLWVFSLHQGCRKELKNIQNIQDISFTNIFSLFTNIFFFHKCSYSRLLQKHKTSFFFVLYLFNMFPLFQLTQSFHIECKLLPSTI